MKKALLVFAGVVVVVVAAALVAPSFIDWNQYKARIVEEIASATGESIAIEGDISLSLLPAPRLSVAGVRLAGPDGGPDRLSLESLDIRVALTPLLGGEIEVASLVLVEPVVRYELDSQGQANWSMIGAAPQADSTATAVEVVPAPSGSEEELALSVQSLRVKNGTLIYVDQRSGQEEKVEGITADISADSLAGPFRMDGGFSYSDQAFDLSASVGRIDRPTGASSTVTLSAAGLGDAKVAWEGTVVPDAPSVQGRVSLSGASLQALNAITKEVGFSLPALAADYEAMAELRFAGGQLAIEDSALRLGNSSLRAAATVSLGELLEAQLELAASRIDLDQLMAAQPEPEPETAGADRAQPVPSDGQIATGFVLPADIAGRVDFTAEALVFQGDTLRDAELRVSLGGGEALVEILGATLPGAAEVFLSGRLATPPEGVAFDGGLEVRANDLRQTLSWLGQDVASVPPDRLRRLILVGDVSAGMEAGGQRLDLTNIAADLDASRLRGGVAVRLGARPGLGVGLSVDRINIDAYLPPPAAGSDAAPQDEGTPNKEAAPDEAQEGVPASDGAALAVLDSFDANFDLRAEELVLQGGGFRGFRAQGSLLAGELTLSELAVASFPGGRGTVSGRLTGLASEPRLEDGRFDVALQEPAELLRYLGRPDEEIVTRLGPVAGRGEISGTMDSVSLSVGFTGLGGSGQSSATLRDVQTAPRVERGSLSLSRMDGSSVAAVLGLPASHPLARLGTFELDLQASGSQAQLDYDMALVALGGRVLSKGKLADYLLETPRLSQVTLAVEGIEAGRLAQLGGLPTSETLTRLGPVNLSSSMDGTLQDLSYNTRLALLGGELRAQGTAQNLPSGVPDFAFDLNVRHNELQRALASLYPQQQVGQVGALDLNAKVSGSPLKLSVAALRAQAGRTSLQGDLSLDMTAARPRLDTKLAFGDVVLSDFVPRAPAQSDGGAGQGGGQSAGGPRWSRAPLPLEPLRQFDGAADVSFASLDTGDVRLDQVGLKARLDGGVLTLERFDGGLGGGTLAASGKVDAAVPASGADTQLDLRLDRIAVGPFLKMAGVEHSIEGLVDFDGRFAARGASELELVSTLNGAGSASGNLRFQPGGFEQGASLVAGLLGAAVPGAQGFTDPVNALFGAFGQAPVALSLTYNADRGVVRSDDILVQGQGARLTGQGVVVDLPRWTTSLDLAVTLGDDPSPYITIALGGPLDSPNASFGGDILKRGLSIDTSGGGATSPKDLIEGIIGGTLGGAGQQPSQQSSEPPAEEQGETGTSEEEEKKDPGKELLKGIFEGILQPK